MEKVFKPLFALLILFTVSCGEPKKEPPKSEFKINEEKQANIDSLQANLDSLNHIEVMNIAKKNNAIIGWDTIKRYSYQLQELLDSINRSISFIGKISDITKKNNGFILKVFRYNENHQKFRMFFLSEISLSFSQLQELNKFILSNKYSGVCCFILKVKQMTSSFPKLTSEVQGGYYEGEDEEGMPTIRGEEATSYLTYDFTQTLVMLKGELVDFYIFKKMGEIDE